jgi:uncharacterized repeat protein (TIGR01451 family)
VAYNLIVTSHSYVAETFDLVDALHFGAGTTVTSAVAGGPSGVTLVPGWNGTSATLLADDQTISARTEAAASTLAFTVTVTFTVSPTITAEARNCALTGNETATGTLNSATVTVRNVSDDATACGDIPSPQADLAIVKTASTANPQLGSSPSFSYTLTVTNAGPDVAQNVVVTDSVPATLTVTGVTTPDFTCVTSGNELSCTRPSLVVGGVAVITVAVVLKADVVSEVQIINSAFVSADTPDPNLSNNSHVAAVTPTGDQESAPPQPPTPDPTLPSTGGDARYLVEVAFGLLAAGLFVAQLARRRRRHLLS